MEYVVKDRQSLLDVSCIVYGRVEKIFELALENNLSLDESLPQGMQIMHHGNETKILNPATDLEGLECGINFMGIEIDFKIS